MQVLNPCLEIISLIIANSILNLLSNIWVEECAACCNPELSVLQITQIFVGQFLIYNNSHIKAW